MKCPMTMNGRSCAYDCEKDSCAWWCSWANCCAMVAIANRNESNFTSIMDSEINRRFGKKVD
jgi:hypothetical protein